MIQTMLITVNSEECRTTLCPLFLACQWDFNLQTSGHFTFTLLSFLKIYRLETNSIYVWGQINPRNQNLPNMSVSCGCTLLCYVIFGEDRTPKKDSYSGRYQMKQSFIEGQTKSMEIAVKLICRMKVISSCHHISI